jgi:gas vesicle protein
MINKMVKGMLLIAAGAAAGAACTAWLMSDSGKKVREEVKEYAEQAKNKMQEYCEKVKQEIENVKGEFAAVSEPIEPQTVEEKPAKKA